MLNQQVKDFLEKNNVREINPVHESYKNTKIIGFHYECYGCEKLWRVRDGLTTVIRKNHLNYSLSEQSAINNTSKFILYLNN